MLNQDSVEEDDQDEEEPAHINIAPKSEKKKAYAISKRLNEFVLLNAMYDQNANYS